MLKGAQDFFVLLSHDTLRKLFKVNFALMQHHKYSLTELENMVFGRGNIYKSCCSYIKEENEKREREMRKMIEEKKNQR